MNFIPLDDDETWVIFGDEAADGLHGLDGSQQEKVLRRLLEIAESELPPSSFVHERIANLDIIAVGDQCRLYTKVVDNIPRGNTEYHVIYLFYIDEAHDYLQRKLATFDPQAQAKLRSITSLDTVRDVEAYLDKNDALNEGDLRDMLS